MAVIQRMEKNVDNTEPRQRFGFEDEYLEGRLTWWQQTKPRIWSMFDEPYSSSAAKVASRIAVERKRGRGGEKERHRV